MPVGRQHLSGMTSKRSRPPQQLRVDPFDLLSDLTGAVNYRHPIIAGSMMSQPELEVTYREGRLRGRSHREEHQAVPVKMFTSIIIDYMYDMAVAISTGGDAVRAGLRE
ncbi:hypothetical protein EW146_g8651 [Bondarzewia mesenterica]|uniref:Uncharacterized protein n=1 Tax=Bondarzewia mesenterica TaxID=1095465 RepID=A0A4S4LED9_9AGAM|nr:hypothetical protein EW146_g8651 [Bondarzewia mesenterica]